LKVGELYAELSIDINQLREGLQESIKLVSELGFEMQKSISASLQSSTKAIASSVKGAMADIDKQLGETVEKTTKSVSELGSDMTRAFGTKPQRAIKQTRSVFSRFVWTARGYIKDTSKVITGILIAQGFYRLLNTIENAGRSLFQFNNDMQQAAISFRLFLGSRREAQAFVDVLQDFAATTPITFQQAQRIAQQMMALGFQAESVIPILRALVDAAAVRGGDVETIEGIARALGQIKTKGKVEMEELMQLAERGIPAIRYLRDELGLTLEEVSNIGRLRIPAETALAAILRGMAEDFGGASEEIAETTRGLVTTISDNLKIIGAEVFFPVFEGIRERLTNLRDYLQQLRTALRVYGVGGLIKEVFPERLQGTIKSILVSLKSLIDSFLVIKDVLSPIVSTTVEFIARVAGLVLPILAALAKTISEVVHWTLNSIPLVKRLVGVIGGLVVTVLVTRGVAMLASAIKALAVAGPIGKLILGLKNALMALHLTMLRNPIIGVITLAAAALLGLALSSKTASRWLDRIMGQLSQLLGIDFEKLYEPADPSDVAEAMKKYNQSLADAIKNLMGVGSEAANAGKEIEDKFLAAFDEVYEVPEKLDELAGAISDVLLGPPVLDKITPPELPDLEDYEDEEAADFPKIKWDPDNFKLPPIVFPTPPIQPPPGAVAENLEAALERMMTAAMVASAAVIVTFDTLGKAVQKVRDSINESIEKVKKVFNTAKEAIVRWVTDTVAAVTQWVSQIPTMINNTLMFIQQQFTNVIENLKEKVSNGLAALRDFWERHKTEVLAIVTILAALVIAGFVGLSAGLKPVLAGLFVFVATTFANMKEAAAAEVEEIKEKVVTKWEEIKTTIGEKLREIRINIQTKWNEIKAYISTCLGEIWADVQTKWDNIKTCISTCVSEIQTSVRTKMESLRDTLSDIWSGINSTASDMWWKLVDIIKAPIDAIIGRIKKFTDTLSNIKINMPRIRMPFGGVVGGGTTGFSPIPKIPGLQYGAVVTKDQLVRIAEKNRPEAVLPLSPDSLRPFAQVLADLMSTTMPRQVVYATEPTTRPIMYVGTLIADERSLKELERKLEIVRIQEQGRRGES